MLIKSACCFLNKLLLTFTCSVIAELQGGVGLKSSVKLALGIGVGYRNIEFPPSLNTSQYSRWYSLGDQ